MPRSNGPGITRSRRIVRAASHPLHAVRATLLLVTNTRATRAIETGRHETVAITSTAHADETGALDIELAATEPAEADLAEDALLIDETPQDLDDDRGVSADLVRAYLNGIGKTKLLTAEGEVDLAKRIEAGLLAEEWLTDESRETDPQLRAAPSGRVITVREVRLAAGAEFVVMVCGDIMTMPGLPKVPSAEKIDLTEEGKVVGLF